jgi:hypothetical protein
MYAMCDHLFDSTSRYDNERKLLTLLLVCPVCRTERVVATLPYEPSFKRFEAATMGALA